MEGGTSDDSPAPPRTRPRARKTLKVLGVLLLGVSVAPSTTARAQQTETNFELYGVPKLAKPLHFDWFTKKDARELTFWRMPGLSPDYRMGPGDELEITIVGMDASYSLQVRTGGEVVIPLMGAVKVGGLTAEEAEAEIGERLRERGLLTKPEVLVYVASYQAKKFWVIGQVDRPGEYAMSQQLTVMDGIFMAGGLDFYGDRHGYLHRRSSGSSRAPSPQTALRAPEVAGPGTEVIKLDLQPMRQGGVLSPDLLIDDGDVIVIPTSYPLVFYVLGDVSRPGAYEVARGPERMTFSQALSQAGGPAKTAQVSKGLIVRYGSDGTRHEVKVDYMAILRGDQSDIEVQSNDVIFIPGSSVKRITLGTLDAIPAVISTIPLAK